MLLSAVPMFSRDIEFLDKSITSLTIPSYSCKETDNQIIDFSRFTQVKTIEIGDECFGSVKTFKIDGLNRLKTIKVGSNSFTNKKNDFGNDESKSFHILNCESLESIQIGEYSFSDFGGDFELKNLPQLQSIQIGTIGIDSYNFHSSSLELESIIFTLCSVIF